MSLAILIGPRAAEQGGWVFGTEVRCPLTFLKRENVPFFHWECVLLDAEKW